MSFKRWWEEKSGKSKTLTALSALLILQIGLCFATPTIQPWLKELFQIRSHEELEALGWMATEAVACIVTVLLLILIAVFWRPESKAPQGEEEEHDR